MIDRQLQSLKDTSIPPVSEAAKVRALAAAMAAYASASTTELVPALPVIAGARSFALRHGYKIAASLAALAVIGPMIALLRAPDPVEMRDQPAAQAPTLPAAKPAEALKAAPPAASAADSTRRVATAAPPPAPLAAATTLPPGALPLPAKLAAPRQQTIRSAPVAPAPALNTPPKVAEAECPPGETCPAAAPSAKLLGTRRVAPKAALAKVATAIEAGRLPERASIDVLSFLNAFEYPSLPSPGYVIARVPAPWSENTQALHLWLAPETSDPLIRDGGVVRLSASCQVRHEGDGQRAVSFDGPSAASVSSGFTFVWTEVAALASAGCFIAIQDDKRSTVIRHEIIGTPYPTLAAAPADIRFAIAVARFAELLSGTAENAAAFGYGETIALAESAKNDDPQGERTAFIALMRMAQAVAR